MKSRLFFPGSFPGIRHEVEIMYFGRPSEFLMMTSERMVITGERHTLGQILDGLRKRGDRWAYELDDHHVICTVNGKAAAASAALEAGDEIDIFSRTSLFDM